MIPLYRHHAPCADGRLSRLPILVPHCLPSIPPLLSLPRSSPLPLPSPPLIHVDSRLEIYLPPHCPLYASANPQLELFLDTWLNDPSGGWTIVRLSDDAMGLWDGHRPRWVGWVGWRSTSA